MIKKELGKEKRKKKKQLDYLIVNYLNKKKNKKRMIVFEENNLFCKVIRIGRNQDGGKLWAILWTRSCPRV